MPAGDRVPGPLARIRVLGRPHAVPGDHPLPAVAVAVQHLDGEAIVAQAGLAQAAEQRVGAVPDGTLPEPGIAGRHVQVPGQPAELIQRGVVRLLRRPEILRLRRPGVQHGHTTAHVAQRDGQVDRLVVGLDHAVPAGHPDPVLVHERDLLRRVLQPRGNQQWAQPFQQGLLGDPGGPVGRADRPERGHREHQRAAGGGQRGDRHPVEHDPTLNPAPAGRSAVRFSPNDSSAASGRRIPRRAAGGGYGRDDQARRRRGRISL